jgi:hypothetical protein
MNQVYRENFELRSTLADMQKRMNMTEQKLNDFEKHFSELNKAVKELSES